MPVIREQFLTPRPLGAAEVWGGADAGQWLFRAPSLDAWVLSRPPAAAVAAARYLCRGADGTFCRALLAETRTGGAEVELAAQMRLVVESTAASADMAPLCRPLADTMYAADGGRPIATAVAMTWYDGELTTLNAGHPRPLWYQRPFRRWKLLDCLCPECRSCSVNAPLGTVPNRGYRQFIIRPHEGDLLALYSRSLSDAAATAEQNEPEEGLLALASTMTPETAEAAGAGLVELAMKAGAPRLARQGMTVLVMQTKDL